MGQFLWIGCGWDTKHKIRLFYLIIWLLQLRKKLMFLLIAFLPPKKKAKKRDFKNRYFLKNGLLYIIIYYYYYIIYKQQNALICDYYFRVNALLHGILPVFTPKHQAHQTTYHMCAPFLTTPLPTNNLTQQTAPPHHYPTQLLSSLSD